MRKWLEGKRKWGRQKEWKVKREKTSHDCKSIIIMTEEKNWKMNSKNQSCHNQLLLQLHNYTIKMWWHILRRLDELWGKHCIVFISGHYAHLISSVGRTERSALKVLREQLFAHKSDLIGAFKKFDRNNAGASRFTERLSPLGFRCKFVFYYASPAFRPLVHLKVRVALRGGNVSSCFCPLKGTVFNKKKASVHTSTSCSFTETVQCLL